IFAAPRQPIRTGCTPPSCSKERVYRGDEMIAMVLAAAGDPSQLLPAREQMAFTLGFHIILVPFGVAFTFFMLVANYRGIRHGDADAMLLAERWRSEEHTSALQ